MDRPSQALPSSGRLSAAPRCIAVLEKLIWSESRPEASMRKAITRVRGRGYFLLRSDMQLKQGVLAGAVDGCSLSSRMARDRSDGMTPMGSTQGHGPPLGRRPRASPCTASKRAPARWWCCCTASRSSGTPGDTRSQPSPTPVTGWSHPTCPATTPPTSRPGSATTGRGCWPRTWPT
jgi:hypothetical protein